MEGNVSEQEQIEAIKKWWKENGKMIVAGLVLGLSILFGGKAWIDYKNTLTEAASMEFEQLLEELGQKNNQAVNTRGEHIIASYPKTPYASLAALALAKIKQEEGDLESAHTRLQWVLDHALQPETLHTARVRLAKVMIAQGEAAQAITLLESITEYPQSFIAVYEETKGDAYNVMGESAKAMQAYRKAIDATSPDMSTQQLQLKLDDIAADAS